MAVTPIYATSNDATKVRPHRMLPSLPQENETELYKPRPDGATRFDQLKEWC